MRTASERAQQRDRGGGVSREGDETACAVQPSASCRTAVLVARTPRRSHAHVSAHRRGRVPCGPAPWPRAQLPWLVEQATCFCLYLCVGGAGFSVQCPETHACTVANVVRPPGAARGRGAGVRPRPGPGRGAGGGAACGRTADARPGTTSIDTCVFIRIIHSYIRTPSQHSMYFDSHTQTHEGVQPWVGRRARTTPHAPGGAAALRLARGRAR